MGVSFLTVFHRLLHGIYPVFSKNMPILPEPRPTHQFPDNIELSEHMQQKKEVRQGKLALLR